MNQGKIWRVVNPTIGVPIFLGAVVVTSLFVHYQLLTKTQWVPAFLQGKATPAKAAAVTDTSTITAQAPAAPKQ